MRALYIMIFGGLAVLLMFALPTIINDFKRRRQKKHGDKKAY